MKYTIIFEGDYYEDWDEFKLLAKVKHFYLWDLKNEY